MRKCPNCRARTAYIICAKCGYDSETERQKHATTSEEVAKAFRALFRWDIEEYHAAPSQAEIDATPLEPVTIDTIKALRANRCYDEADNLLRAYQTNKHDAKEQLRRELNRQDAKKNNAGRKRLGLCRWGGCDEPNNGKMYCARHTIIDNFYAVLLNAIFRKRGRNVCLNCHAPRMKGRYFCPGCAEKRIRYNECYRYLYSKTHYRRSFPGVITDYEGKEVKL
jgi:predicted amidophosphoribosyltransferase